MATCAKCGQEVGGFAGLLSHTCVPREELSKEEVKRRNDEIRFKARQELQRDQRLKDLDREVAMANKRDFGEADAQVDRFGDSARTRRVWNPDKKDWDTLTLDRTGSALELEAKNGGTPAFDADRELPEDAHERSEVRAREMRFPNEQRRHIEQEGFTGGNLKTGVMTPEEQAEFDKTGKTPEVIANLKPYEQQRNEQFERFKAEREAAAHPQKQEALDLELGLG